MFGRDFSLLPPEINSTLIYSGPGASSWYASACQWDNIADQLHSAAAGYRMIVADLLAGNWTGPTAITMAHALLPYATWMGMTALKAEHIAQQIRLAASAYEAAHHSSVPPELVWANRHELAVLVATNFFGQNAPAIAANWAAYYAMWAQDALAMDTYAHLAHHARQLPQFESPPHGAHQPATLITTPTTSAHALPALPSSAESTTGQTATIWGIPQPISIAHLAGLSPSATQAVDSFFAQPTSIAQIRSIIMLVPQLANYATSFASRGLTIVAAVAERAEILSAEQLSHFIGRLGAILAHSASNAEKIGSLSVPSSWTKAVAHGSGVRLASAISSTASSASSELSPTMAKELIGQIPAVLSTSRKPHEKSSMAKAQFCMRPQMIPGYSAVG